MSSIRILIKTRQEEVCKTRKPNGVVFEANEISIQYKRKKLKKKECSGGFICEIYTVGAPPLDDLILTYQAKQQLLYSMEYLENVVDAARGLLQRLSDVLKNNPATSRKKQRRQAQSSSVSERSLERLIELLALSVSAIRNPDAGLINSTIAEMLIYLGDVDILLARVSANPSNFNLSSVSKSVDDGFKI
ncbi:uncharacterized protein LOC135220672 [Macrobrachium nipponense]|uniref:uncharacterized protein LOC135220672 n=1 Tax=Macrobrachium nipponense TaxID=159736 RepID=UPI0030C7E509